MSETERTREVVERYFATMAAKDWDTFGTLLSDDVVYEMPQTRERISGRDKYLRFNREYPGDWTCTVTRLIADGTSAAGSLNFAVEENELVALVYFELRDGLIVRITDFWPEPYEPPAGREELVERVPGEVDRLSVGSS
ncbi:nuclear transport factor 2 family protein [Kribbella speibonae]|uniref:Nuclear transport factor 2 family protein n=1 Tax=Kribbella speibonae TaxID=1572660 RepID=A0ABY1ZTQ5_9ACTN|nr:nuclear transport factor 2 family protein [Kribbella speibonae]TCC15783.1 nuclear transport factor 2 family protein [Kribbella speibonae]